MGMSEESMEARCARYKAERDLARQDAVWLRAKIDECVARGMGGEAARLSEEDAEAARWVCEQGGLKTVQARYWFAGQCAAIVTGEAEGVASGGMLLDLLRDRLLPDGMEWPRDAKGVRILRGDTVWANGSASGDGRCWHVRRVSPGTSHPVSAVDERGEERDLRSWWLTHERPAPEVLDADGVEIRVGDTVWSTRGPESGTVVYAYPPGDDVQPSVKVGAVWRHASELTHRAPVIAADGKPLREGETVWFVPTPGEAIECTVEKLHDPEITENVLARAVDRKIISCPPGYLTHERPNPDSWERLEEDATKNVCVYFKEGGGNTCDGCRVRLDERDCNELMQLDLVCRAKKLAGEA